MPKGAVPERDVQCRACGTTFRTTRCGKAAFYCRTPACDDRRARERIVIPNANPPSDLEARRAAKEERARARAAERETTKRRAAAARRAHRERRAREREVQRARARLERLEPVARARRDEVVELVTRIAELERRPVELPAWLAGDRRLDVARAALAADLLGAWARHASGHPVPNDDEIAEMALAAVRAGGRGRRACILLAGAALARAQALHEREARAAA